MVFDSRETVVKFQRMPDSTLAPTPSTAAFSAQIEFGPVLSFDSAMLQQLMAYWTSKLGNRTFPSLDAISPTEIPFFLPFLHMYDITGDGGSYWVRFHGTRISRFVGSDLTGDFLTPDSKSRVRRYLVSRLNEVVERPGPVRLVTTFGVPGDPPLARVENFAAPLTAAGGTSPVTILVGTETHNAFLQR